MGNIVDTSFKEIWKSKRYWEVMDFLASDKFNAKKDCGSLCLQHKVNEFLLDLRERNISLKEVRGEPPLHINFV